MNQDRVLFLLERYSQNLCSELETAELVEWFHSYNPGRNDMDVWITESGGVDKLSEELFEQFSRLKVERKVIWRYITNLAAGLLLFSSALLIYFHSKTPVTHRPDSAIAGAYKIKPGGNKAILTLANGSQIALNTAGNGHIALQNNMQISKLSAGRISYKAIGKNQESGKVLYNKMATPRGGRFDLTLADGTEVTLDAESSIIFPVAFTGKERRVEVTGQVYFNVIHNAAQPFRVSVKNQTIQDIGTAFNINAYDDDQSVKITLTEGSADVSNSSKKVILRPGEQAQIENRQTNIIVKKANICDVVAWRNGWFAFHHESIKNVMKQAARWYDVDIDCQGLHLNKEFGGTISRYKDISELLENLRIAGGINYKIEGRRVILIN